VNVKAERTRGSSLGMQEWISKNDSWQAKLWTHKGSYTRTYNRSKHHFQLSR
jgi:hypothetical protein